MNSVQNSKFLSHLPLIATIVAIVSGAIGIWAYLKPTINSADLSGIWTVTFKVEESTPSKYIGDIYVYDIYVSHIQDMISGSGEQVLYNGDIAKSHFKLEFKSSTYKDEQLCIPYTLYGSRETSGILIVNPDPKNQYHYYGRFEGGAADSKGLAEVIIRKEISK